MTETDGLGDAGGALAPVLARLSNKLDRILLTPDQPMAPLDSARVLDLTLKWLKEQDAPPEAVKTIVHALDQHAPPIGHPAFPEPPKDTRQVAESVAALPATRSPLHDWQAVYQGIVQAMQAPGAKAETFASLLTPLGGLIEAADRLGLWEYRCDSRWVETILLRRLGRDAEALGKLAWLAQEIGAVRLRIPDPRWRAGLAVYLKHLPWVMAQTAFRLGDGAALLHAMETSKARILAELRDAHPAMDAPREPRAFLDAVRSGLAAGRRRHVLAFLADTTADQLEPGAVGVLAALVTADGEVLAREIPLAPPQIVAALAQIQKRIRGGQTPWWKGIDPAHPEERLFDHVIAAVSPLVGWLAPLLGTHLKEGDTLIVSPDGPIHNVPFAMLTLAGAPLIDRFAIVSIPSSALLTAQKAAERPGRALAVLAPSPSERTHGETYASEAKTLSSFLSTAIVSDITDAKQVASPPLPALLHVAAHGEANSKRPLAASGLRLGEGPMTLFTAEEMGALALSGAHVSLRACLVGIATEVTSREALGFVWAIFGAGCASLVSALCAVNIESGQRFFAYFYEAWLAGNATRADAYRKACLALRAEGGPFAHPYHWAAFTLSCSTLSGDIA